MLSGIERDRFIVMTTQLIEHYRDAHLLVIEKPFGLPSQPTRKGEKNLYAMLSQQESYIGLHHRLDTPASGLMLFTLHRSVNANIAEGFRDHTIKRSYLLVVVGETPDAGTWDSALDGKEARTHFSRLGSRDSLSLLEVQLETGRTHQIRRHASSAGFPIVGDRRYGGNAGRLWERLALHAHQLQLTHPVTGKALEWKCAIPSDLKELIDPISKAR